MSRLAMILRRFRKAEDGMAAVEMALVTSIFVVAMLNAVEVGRYAYVTMEAEQATQAGAQAAFATCDLNHTPATQKCPALVDAVTTAVQSTSLGSHVTLNGAMAEAYYCVDASGALVQAGDLSSKPADCSAYGSPSVKPGLYLQVNTTYAYSPMFGGLTIGQTLPGSVQKTAWMRMS